MVVIKYFNKSRELYLKYEKILLPTSFFIGLFWDNFTLRRADMPYENAVFVWSLFQAAILILLLNAYNAGRLQNNIFNKVAPFLPVFLQFAFGNLFSGFIIFYIRSGSVFASWPFLLLLGILFVGNEFFRKRYTHLPFQIGVLFIAIFSYTVFSLPVLINKMGALVFLISGGLALLIVAIIISLLIIGTKGAQGISIKRILTVIGSIYLIFNILYFTNIIPPIPLVLKDSGIYHSIEKVSEGNYIYKMTFEPGSKTFPFFKEQSNVFHFVPGASVYFYNSIFSPADLNMPIFHRWMRFDEDTKKWTEVTKISFDIKGGRASGYRGYSYIKNIFAGKWRVDVITERGQILGRRTFTAAEATSVPILETVLR